MQRKHSRTRIDHLGPLRYIHRHRQLISLNYRKLATVAFLSMLGGIGQAALLLVIVRGATALTAGTESISGSVGPLSAQDLSTADLTAIGFGVLAMLLVIEIFTSLTQASLTVEASRRTQHHMLHQFTSASFEAQTMLPRGEARQVVMGYPTYAGGIAGMLGSGLSSAMNFIVLVGSAVVLSPAAALVLVVGISVLILALRPILLLSRRLSDRRTRQQRSVSALTGERFELCRELKSVGAERQADQPILEGIDLVSRTDRRLRFVSRMSSVIYRLGAFALVLTMLAVIDASNTTNVAALTGSMLMLLRSLSYGQGVQSSIQSLGETIPTIEQMIEEAQRLANSVEVLSAESAPDDFHIGRVEFDQVDFAYPGSERVLHDVSFAIDPGDFVAVIGSSGAGKSTLMQLLLRLRQPTIGHIMIDDKMAGDVPLSWWRSRVAYVAQEPKLQSGTVAAAIRFGRAGISDDQVREAARRAHIADEIESWPGGYDTEVSQLGEGLSGGQRQRVALARALVGEPDLLLLDEPTSALDPVSEQLVAQTLDELTGEMTIVVIAHRIHTVENAGRIVRVEHGRVRPVDPADESLLADLADDRANGDSPLDASTQ